MGFFESVGPRKHCCWSEIKGSSIYILGLWAWKVTWLEEPTRTAAVLGHLSSGVGGLTTDSFWCSQMLNFTMMRVKGLGCAR